MKYVIIGNGVAGTTAAGNIRKVDASGGITMITEEEFPFYSRIRLIDFLAGGLEKEKLTLKPARWYKENSIELVTGKKVSEINADSHEVVISSGEKIGYEKLLLATGAHAFVPPIPGADREGVFSLRSLKDAIKIIDEARSHKRVVVIGGGVLGLEAGNSLAKLGCDVTVLEFFDRLLPRQMDVEGARILTAELEGMGLKFFIGASTKEITGSSRVDGLTLEDGTRIDCDMIIISAGVRPNVSLAEPLGLKVNRGLLVNDKMETAISGIYAAGDLIEHNGIFYGLWMPSDRQGEVAGINMAGGDALYGGTAISNTLKVAGVKLLSAGDIDVEGKHTAIVLKDEKDFIYKKMVLNGNRIVGAILYGDMAPRAKILKAIESGVDVTPFMEELKEWDLKSL